MTTVRDATADDLAAIVRLTRRNRQLLAELEPNFWRQAQGADEMHAAFMRMQLDNPAVRSRVLEDDGVVIGCALSSPHPAGFAFIDDVSLSAERNWHTDGMLIFGAIDERPAHMTAPHGDVERVIAVRNAGLVETGTVRSLRFDAPVSYDEPAVEINLSHAPPSPIRHVWQPAMSAASAVGTPDAFAVISPPIRPPPIFDPGGLPSVVDVVVGADRRGALLGALGYAQQRGDLGVILIIDARDLELSNIADSLGAQHPVDVFEWPRTNNTS